jgi:hypothetical protein
MKKTTFIIIKEIILPNNRKQSIVLLNGAEDVWEFQDEEEANRIALAFEKNSDSGWKYKVKEIKG